MVLRPRTSLLTGIGLSAILVGAAALGWGLLPAEIQAQFTGLQAGTLIFFILVMIAMMLGIGLSSVRVTDSGLRIRNGVRTHQVRWSEIEGFRLTPDDPWAFVLLHGDPDQRAMLGVQRTDGDRARAAVVALNERLLKERSR